MSNQLVQVDRLNVFADHHHQQESILSNAVNTRIYCVTVTADAATGRKSSERLVRAPSQSQASNHVTKGMVTCEVAQQEDLYRLAKAGQTIEDTSTEKTTND